MKALKKLNSIQVSIFLYALILLNLYLLRFDLNFVSILFLLVLVSLTNWKPMTPLLYSYLSIVALLIFNQNIPWEFAQKPARFWLFPEVHIFSYFLCLIFLTFISGLFYKLPRTYKQPIFLIIFYYCVVPYFVRQIPNSYEWKNHLEVILIKLSYFGWYFIFLVQDFSFAPKGFLKRIGFLMPFQQLIILKMNYFAYFQGPKAYEINYRGGKLNEERRAALVFLFFNLMLSATAYLVHFWMPKLSLDKINQDFFFADGSLIDYLIKGHLYIIYLYSYYFGAFNLMVSLVRIGGVHYPPVIRLKLFKSKSFLDFFASVYVYVKEIYEQLFYYPIFLMLKRIGGLKLRMALSTFVSVFAGSILFHSASCYSCLIRYGWFGYHRLNPAIWVNSLIISLVLLGSQLFKKKKENYSFFRFSIYVVFFIVTCFVENWPKEMPIENIISIYISKIF